jgi:lipoprotein-releasing system ATP-binding protein
MSELPMASSPPPGLARVAGAVSARAVSKTYVGGDARPLEVLSEVDLEVRSGESVAIVGASGSGKSTLLHLLGGLDRPTSGEVWLGSHRLDRLAEEALARLRASQVGFVFQFHHLLREFTALENVMMPQRILGRTPQQARERARELLCRMGLEGRLEHTPGRLSGGEQQRVAVARALANDPLVVLADEPSGNLDPHTSERLHNLLFEVNRERGGAMVLVTHDAGLAARADRLLRMEDGRLVLASES